MFVPVSRICMYVLVLYLYLYLYVYVFGLRICMYVAVLVCICMLYVRAGLPLLYVCAGIVFVCNWSPVFVCMWRYWGTRPILHGVELERSLRWPVTDGII